MSLKDQQLHSHISPEKEEKKEDGRKEGGRNEGEKKGASKENCSGRNKTLKTSAGAKLKETATLK